MYVVKTNKLMQIEILATLQVKAADPDTDPDLGLYFVKDIQNTIECIF